MIYNVRPTLSSVERVGGQDRVVQSLIKLTQGYRAFQFCNFLVWCSVHIVCPVVLSSSNLKLHQTLEVRNIPKQEKIMLNVNVNLLSNHPALVTNGVARFHTLRRSPLARIFFRSIYVKMQMLVVDICL